MTRRKGGPVSELGRGLRQMTPNRVTARFMSGGKYQTWGAIARAVTRTGTGQRSIPMRAVPMGSPVPTSDAAAKRARAAAVKKTASKKSAGKGRSDAYAAARQIPARNQAVAKKAAAATAAARKPGARKSAAGNVLVPKRNPDGTFDGMVSFPTFGPAEQAAYERALRGQVDPVQQVRQPRRWR